MDIGNGYVQYTIDGSDINLESPVLDNGSLDANSIVFIDRSVLKDVVYVSRSDAEAILKDALSGTLNSNDYEFGTNTGFIVDFVAMNTTTEISGELVATDKAYMDVNGALFVPFEPIDFIEKKNIDSVTLVLEWNLDMVFTAENQGTYTLNTSTDGTPFNFNITIEM